MSLKRYATLAAVSHNNNNNQMAVTTSTTTTTTTATPTEDEDDSSSEDSSSQEFGSSSTSSFTTYLHGGLHQRGASGGGGGGSLGSANPPHSYANVVNGNVNLLLGGAMLSLVTTILCVVCYCCHRNIKKRTEAAYRQQRQWLENDPNMEIYSVEQCYETSGLFLGDSTDGLAALPALHHEPPPSYDAVVLHEQQLLQQQQQLQQLQQQQHLQQQQQLLLQRDVSPPPGYHSTLDISHLAATTGNRGAPDGESHDNGQSNSHANKLAALHLKRVMNAQSCCSLQRAEVENMWNAAAAAVAARSSGNCLELQNYSQPRLNTFGRRYLQQSHQQSHHGSHYRRGCPLCGKFRYEAEASSIESGLDSPPTTSRAAERRLDRQLDDNENEREERELEAGRDEQLPTAPPPECLCPSDDNGNAISEDPLNGNVEEEANRQISETAENNNNPEEEEEEAAAVGNLDSINENGIISLDMSKIIDRSGLPSYEGAIKLESSGYV